MRAGRSPAVRTRGSNWSRQAPSGIAATRASKRCRASMLLLLYGACNSVSARMEVAIDERVGGEKVLGLPG